MSLWKKLFGDRNSVDRSSGTADIASISYPNTAKSGGTDDPGGYASGLLDALPSENARSRKASSVSHSNLDQAEVCVLCGTALEHDFSKRTEISMKIYSIRNNTPNDVDGSETFLLCNKCYIEGHLGTMGICRKIIEQTTEEQRAARIFQRNPEDRVK